VQAATPPMKPATPPAVAPAPTLPSSVPQLDGRGKTQAPPQHRSFPGLMGHVQAGTRTLQEQPCTLDEHAPRQVEGKEPGVRPSLPSPPPVSREGVRQRPAGLPRTGSAPPTSGADYAAGAPAPAAPPPPPPRLEARSKAPATGSGYGPQPAEAKTGPAREERGSPWTPFEGTVPEEGQQTLVCCWLQSSGASVVTTPEGDRGARSSTLACVLQ